MAAGKPVADEMTSIEHQLIVLFLVLFPDNFLIKKCLYQLEHHEIDRG